MAGTSADSEASQTERLVDVAGESIRYWEAGAGEVVVILDGGGAGMAQLQDALVGKYRVIRLEPDGTGASKDAASLTGQAVREITSEKITLIAASLATHAAIMHTLGAPEDVESLVLISPVVGATAAGDGDGDVEGRMGEIECATLVVFGLNDRTMAPEAAGVYKASIPNCNVSLVYDAGRDIMADRPEALIDVVSDFVERGEAFIVARAFRPDQPVSRSIVSCAAAPLIQVRHWSHAYPRQTKLACRHCEERSDVARLNTRRQTTIATATRLLPPYQVRGRNDRLKRVHVRPPEILTLCHL